MRRLLLIVVAIMFLAMLGYMLLPSTSRDRTREAIDRLGYWHAFYCLGRATEEYNLRSFSAVPDSIEQLADAKVPELGAEEQHNAETLAKILSRVVIKPKYQASDGNTYGWVAAVLVPRGQPHWREYVYFDCGATGDGIAHGSSYALSDDFAKRFGGALLEELRQATAAPAKLEVVALPRPATLSAHQGSWPDGRPEPRWYVVSDRRQETTSSTATTRPTYVCESRDIATFLRPLTFATGAWRDGARGSLDSQASRLRLGPLPCDGGAGDDTVRLSLRTLRDAVITMSYSIQRDNAATLLSLRLRDEHGRTARWDFDLAGTTGAGPLRPRDGATLAKPNVPPADGQPLDLARIVCWELMGDQDKRDTLHLEIRGIKIEGPRASQ